MIQNPSGNVNGVHSPEGRKSPPPRHAAYHQDSTKASSGDEIWRVWGTVAPSDLPADAMAFQKRASWSRIENLALNWGRFRVDPGYI